jgi:wobble nucleotide-excising tRNase
LSPKLVKEYQKNKFIDAYKKKKNFYKSHQNEQKRIDKIEDDVAEIKQMLQQLLKRS